MNTTTVTRTRTDFDPSPCYSNADKRVAAVSPAVPAEKPAPKATLPQLTPRESAAIRAMRAKQVPGYHRRNVTALSAEYPSKGNPDLDVWYLVYDNTEVSGRIECSCPAGEKGVPCWHVAAFEDDRQTARVQSELNASVVVNAFVDDTEGAGDYDRYALTEEISDVLPRTAPEGAEAFGSIAMPSTDDDTPRPEWIRGTCPDCGGHLVSNGYRVGGRGVVVYVECWASLAEVPACTYRRVL